MPLSSDHSASLAGRCILILEDEPLLAFDYADEFTDRGAKPAIAHTVAAALEIVSKGKIELAVLDVNLGPEFCWPVAERLTGQGIPFFLVSGWSMKGRLPPKVSPNDCLDKPISAQIVADRLTAIARRAE